MKFICSFLFLTMIISSSCKQNKPAIKDNQNSKIYSLDSAFQFQYKAMDLYNKNPILAATFLQKAANAYLQNGKKKDAGIMLANLGHIYEESYGKLDSALILAEQGFEYSKEANDTLNIGHGYRYTGFLLGVLGNTQEGIDRIEKSKSYYLLRNFQDAIAVADYDEARVYYKAKSYDRADQQLTKSTDYFKGKQNLNRIFNNNLFALRLYRESGNLNKYKLALSENENLMQSGKIGENLQKSFLELKNKK